MHIYCHQKTCTIMFTAALFIIAQNWKLPKCLSTVRWVNKSWYSHTIWPYTARRMDNLQLLTTRMDLTNRRLTKGSQRKRVQTMRFHLYKVPNQAKRMHSVRILDTAYLRGLGGVKTRRVTGISGLLGMFCFLTWIVVKWFNFFFFENSPLTVCVFFSMYIILHFKNINEK